MKLPIITIFFHMLMLCSIAFADGSLHETEINGTVKSVDTRHKVKIEFINNSSNLVKLYWLDYKGKRRFYSWLPNNKNYVQETYLSHPWLVTDSKDNALDIYYPDTSKRTIIIR